MRKIAFILTISFFANGFLYARQKTLHFVGDLYTRNILEAKYAGSFNKSDTVSWEWYVTGSANENGDLLQGIHTRQLVLLSSYAGKFIRCILTIKNADGKISKLSAVTDQPVKDMGNPHTDWFKDAGFGLMLHFLKSSFAKDGGSKEWNDIVNGFDTEKFATDCKAAGVGYVLFALGQNSGYYCSPNKAYDSITGVTPGELCSLRDLPADLSVSLSKRGIRLMFYLPGNPPIHNQYVADKFKYSFGKDAPTSQYTQACWEAVIREWSLRYGKSLSGWWFDGMYSGGIIETRSDMSLPHNISTHTLAAKAGNHESIITYNYGVQKIRSNSPYDDYSAGEKQDLDEVPAGRWVAPGVQWFFFTYLGKWWGQEGQRFDTNVLTGWVQKVFKEEGVVCFDIHADASGRISPNHIAQLKAVRHVLDDIRKSK